MVSQHVRNDASSSRHPSWPTVFEQDVREISKFLDHKFAGLQSWDPLTSYASQVPDTKHLPAKATHPSQFLGLGSERSYAGDAAGPSSTMGMPRTALQGPSCAECGVSSISRPPAVRNPTGAPPSDRLSVASRSLLSPINLESPSDQGSPEIGSRDPSSHLSNPYCNGEFQNNCRPIRATSESLIGIFDDPQVHSKSVDCTERTPKPSVLQDEKLSTPSSHGRTSSPQPEFFQRELSHCGMPEYLVQRTRKRVIESERLGENPAMPVEGDPFVSGGGSRPTAIEDGLIRRAHKASSGYFPPCVGTPESPIKITEQGGCVEEAHFTTVISPSRPQIVTISRRGSSVRPLSRVDSLQPSSPLQWDYHPITPPEGPTTTPTTSRRIYEAHETGEMRRTSEAARANPRPPFTPPNSPVETAASSEFYYPKAVPRDSRLASYRMKRYQPMAWILDELEFLVGNFPSTRLQLDSPVIQHIRREITNAARSSSADPQLSLHPIPRSRYSTRSRDTAFGSFSSHSLRHSSAEGFSSAEVCGMCPPLFGSPYSISPPPSTPSMSTTLYALRTVFPHASSHTLKCVQATSFALAYVSSVCTSHVVPSFAPPVLANTYCAVPPKAQEMLGLKVHPDPLRSGTSWLRSQTPECFDDERSAQRLESLTVSLNKLFRELLTEVGGRQLGTGDGPLARAVQEMIRLGEGDGDGEEVREGDRMCSCGGGQERGYGWECPHEWVT